VAERQLPKLNVAGSIPVSRSNQISEFAAVPFARVPSKSPFAGMVAQTLRSFFRAGGSTRRVYSALKDLVSSG
jgi:hypothetical protein